MGEIRNPASVVVADDHPLVIEGVRRLLATTTEFVLTGCYTDGEEALRAIERTPPDLAILDLYMPKLSGLEVLRALENRSDVSTRVIFFGAALEDREIHEAMAHGALGILFKDTAPADLLLCLRAVRRGERWIPETVQTAAARERERLRRGSQLQSLLTSRERQVTLLASRGLSNTEIASELGMSLATVKVHMHRIYPKLGASNRNDIVEIGREHADFLR